MLSKAISFEECTCLGLINPKFPVDYGNKFSVCAIDNKTYTVANMFYENLEHLIDIKLLQFPIDILIFNNYAFIVDCRVPENYCSEVYIQL